ncbi:MAG: hypothetical protein L3J31_05895 [Bacteroidales bacterium]|nr:hypothetical protein [Bacteroidales bacterium]MCF6342321.1 hypothetical protein [Bacteroidales bacterium]
MKGIKLFFLVIMMIAGTALTAQIAINTDGSNPDASSMLDIKSTSSGFLAPRMTQAQRNAIGSPATSLLIYQTDNTPGYYYYNGSTWQRIVDGDDGDWTISGSNLYSSVSGYVGIGTSIPGAKLDIRNKGTEDILNLFDDATEVFTVEDGGYVGIGNDNPSVPLHILSTSTPQFRIDYSKTIWGYTGAEFYINASGDLSINTQQTTGSTSARNIYLSSAGGKVGIGTSSPVTDFDVDGSVGMNIITKTANYTIADDDGVYTIVSGSTITITLPTAADNTGRILIIKRGYETGLPTTVDGEGSETIDGQPTYSLGGAYSSVTIQCDGEVWWIIGQVN